MAAERILEDLEGAKGRLQAGVETVVPEKRTKIPASFHVFMLDENEAWAKLTEDQAPIVASTRKAAREAAVVRAEADTSGKTLWAIPADQFQPRKRKTRTEVIDTWEE